MDTSSNLPDNAYMAMILSVTQLLLEIGKEGERERERERRQNLLMSYSDSEQSTIKSNDNKILNFLVPHG